MNWNNNLSSDDRNDNYHDKDKYDDTTVFYIKMIYIIAAIAWIGLIFALNLLQSDIFVILILLIPLVVFFINYISVGEFSCCTEAQMFRSNFLSFGFLVAVVLINWNSPIGNHDKVGFFRILIVAFIFLMISLVDLWVPKNKMSIVKHIKTSLQTASLALLALALYLYYVYHRDRYIYEF